ITPDASALPRKMSAEPPSETAPSCIPAPPESLRPITGAPVFKARSMILQIFSACASESEPPKTVKSCENTYTSRPSIRPWPVTTPSPRYFSSARPKSLARWVTNRSSSTNEPGSSSASSRSRAVSLPFSCCVLTQHEKGKLTARERLEALQLALLVLRLDAVGAAAQLGLGALLLQQIQLLAHGHGARSW